MRVDREAAVSALAAEVARRNEWYGLDNWSFGEVVDFVLQHAVVSDENPRRV